jgi:cystathionine gamma-synthase
MLFPTEKIANSCRAFIQERLCQSGADVSVRLPLVCPDDLKRDSKSGPADISVDLHIVLLPKDAFGIAKEFWQHTGLKERPKI